MGELGWDLEKYKRSTVYEFNKASQGYWRNIERGYWPLRELIFYTITGNPYIKPESKPTTPEHLFKLSIDKEPEPIDMNEVREFENKIKG